MKLLLTLFVVAAFIPAAVAQRADYKIKKVQPQGADTPEYSVNPRGHQSRAGKWLEIEVEFQSDVDFTDELTFRYYVALSTQNPDFANKVLVGEVTHVNIPKNRSMYSVMFISPRAIERVLAGKTFTPSSIENITVQLSRQGQVLATEHWKRPGSDQWFTQMQQIPGFLLNKSETPFAPLAWDRYEAIKPAQR